MTTLDPAEQALREATAALAASERAEQAPDTLLPGVMRGVWADLRRNRMLPIPDVSGPAHVATHVVTRVLERAVAPLDAVQLRTADLQADDAQHRAVSVRLEILVRHGVDIAALTDQARLLVRRAIGEHFGWRARAIDIDVLDVFLAEDADDER